MEPPNSNQGQAPRSTRRQHNAPTIADVAKAAGVSPMTVSRVINGESSVRTNTRERVEEAIASLNYIPNSSARQLAGGKPMQVGLISDDNPNSAYLSGFLLGALEQTSQMNVQLAIERTKTIEGAIESAKRLMSRGVDGFVLPPPLSDVQELIAFFEHQGIPTVAISSGRVSGASNVSVVGIDDQQAAYQMTQHILSLGHTRIGFIQGNPRQAVSVARLKGYQQALAEAGIESNADWVVQGQFTYRSGIEAAGQLLNLMPRPTAIFASNDEMAAATVALAFQLGLNVPQQLTVCGFDDSAMATSIWPSLTTIHQPIADMSRNAIKMLIENLRDLRAEKPLEAQHLLLEYTFVQRESDASIDANPFE